MPESIKSHSSHDILLICLRCHSKYEPFTVRKKQEYSIKYSIPLEGEPWVHYIENKAVKAAAKALLTSRQYIPAPRIAELEQVLRSHFHTEHITPSLLEEAVALPLTSKGPGFREHGQVVVEAMSEAELIDFVREWRAHFLEYAQPRFLSANWRAENDVIRH